jgi:hypothetical protein
LKYWWEEWTKRPGLLGKRTAFSITPDEKRGIAFTTLNRLITWAKSKHTFWFINNNRQNSVDKHFRKIHQQFLALLLEQTKKVKSRKKAFSTFTTTPKISHHYIW